jgi:tetratricopeptide (TPR) repeat protein
VTADESFQAATLLITAGDCLVRIKDVQYIDYYKEAARLLCSLGHHSRAGQLLRQIGVDYEASGKLKDAVTSYEEAARLFNLANATSQELGALAQAAELNALRGKFDKAILTFDIVVHGSLRSSLLKWGAQKYMLRAYYCNLAKGNALAAKTALHEYKQLAPGMKSSWSYKLAKAISNQDDVETLLKMRDVPEIASDPWLVEIIKKIAEYI